MLQSNTIATIQATVPVLQEHGRAITTRFYQLLFEHHPELRNVFNQSNQREGRQQAALAGTIYAAAAHIENLETLAPAVRMIAQKHRSLGIKPEHYPLVGTNLLLAIQDVLNLPADHEVIRAWGEAYGVIADLFIQTEAELYEQASAAPGGWDGFRDFVVVRKVRESEVITSLYLQPKDGTPLASFLPGQYVTVKAAIPGEAITHLRQYSLSDRPGTGYYRISVKHEAGGFGQPAGKVSTWLHTSVGEGDLLALSAPAGEFILDSSSDIPVVLISAGVGLTPMLSMLNTLTAEQPGRDVTFLHAARNSRVHAMRNFLTELTSGKSNVRSYVSYSQPLADDVQNGYCDAAGRLHLDSLPFSLPGAVADYYVCGPTSFMKEIYTALRRAGIPDARIHYEAFGPDIALRQTAENSIEQPSLS